MAERLWVRMANAEYRKLDGTKVTVTYDRAAPCIVCGLPVVEASVGGTAVCPWCDTGTDRQGNRINTMRLRKATPEEYEAARAELMTRLADDLRDTIIGVSGVVLAEHTAQIDGHDVRVIDDIRVTNVSVRRREG